MKILRRAISDTFGHLKALIVAGIGGLLALLALYLGWGRDMAFDEAPYYLTGIIGAFGAVAILFFLNLVTAPRRMWKERALAAEAELVHYKPRPRPQLSQAEIEVISRSAILASEKLAELIPPLSNTAWEVHLKWENNSYSYDNKDSWLGDLMGLSQETYAMLGEIAELKSSPRYRGDGLEFAFDFHMVHSAFKQAIDAYNNAVRELSEGQNIEILRLYNQNLVFTLGKLEMHANNSKRILGLISKDPSQFYGVDINRL